MNQLLVRKDGEKTQSLFEQKSHKPAKTFTGHFPLTTLLRCPK